MSDAETSRIHRSDLRDLVMVTSGDHGRITAVMPQLELLALLREQAEPAAPVVVVEPVRPGRIFRDRGELVLAFLASIVAGVVMGAPYWW